MNKKTITLALLALTMSYTSTFAQNASKKKTHSEHHSTKSQIIIPSEHTYISSIEELAYPKSSLNPTISQMTMEFHHDKHYQGYINNLKKLVLNTELQDKSLEQIICSEPSGSAIFNNAGQIYNHKMFFDALSPKPQLQPSGKFEQAIIHSFGSINNFKDQFNSAAKSLFGSGWVFLVSDKNGNLQIIPTSNAQNPLTQGKQPLMCIDVWEHAYYLDYQNRRADFIESFWNVFDWNYPQQKFNELKTN